MTSLLQLGLVGVLAYFLLSQKGIAAAPTTVSVTSQPTPDTGVGALLTRLLGSSTQPSAVTAPAQSYLGGPTPAPVFYPAPIVMPPRPVPVAVGSGSVPATSLGFSRQFFTGVNVPMRGGRYAVL